MSLKLGEELSTLLNLLLNFIIPVGLDPNANT